MLNPKLGEIWTRITPPSIGVPGYSQSGKITKFGEEVIAMDVQVDVIRQMTFRRSDGFDTLGLGTFIVKPDVEAKNQELHILSIRDATPTQERTYFSTGDAAQLVINTLPPFEASRYIGDVKSSNCGYKIVEFERGFAIQLGDYGAYYPATTADETEVGV